MHWIIGIVMGFMALLSHQTAPLAVSTPIPAIIEAPKGVVLGARETDKFMIQAAVGGATEKVSGQNHSDESHRSATTTSFINPNQSFMETHVPENTPESVEPKVEEQKPYVTPTEPSDGQVDGMEYRGAY